MYVLLDGIEKWGYASRFIQKIERAGATHTLTYTHIHTQHTHMQVGSSKKLRKLEPQIHSLTHIYTHTTHTHAYTYTHIHTN